MSISQEAHILIPDTIRSIRRTSGDNNKEEVSDEKLSQCMDNLIAEMKSNHSYELFKDEGSIVNVVMSKTMRLYEFKPEKKDMVYNMIVNKLQNSSNNDIY